MRQILACSFYGVFEATLAAELKAYAAGDYQLARVDHERLAGIGKFETL
jgi:hypothetical protein